MAETVNALKEAWQVIALGHESLCMSHGTSSPLLCGRVVVRPWWWAAVSLRLAAPAQAPASTRFRFQISPPIPQTGVWHKVKGDDWRPLPYQPPVSGLSWRGLCPFPLL